MFEIKSYMELGCQNAALGFEPLLSNVYCFQSIFFAKIQKLILIEKGVIYKPLEQANITPYNTTY